MPHQPRHPVSGTAENQKPGSAAKRRSRFMKSNFLSFLESRRIFVVLFRGHFSSHIVYSMLLHLCHAGRAFPSPAGTEKAGKPRNRDRSSVMTSTAEFFSVFWPIWDIRRTIVYSTTMHWQAKYCNASFRFKCLTYLGKRCAAGKSFQILLLASEIDLGRQVRNANTWLGRYSLLNLNSSRYFDGENPNAYKIYSSFSLRITCAEQHLLNV